MNVLLDLCAIGEGSWVDTFADLAVQERKYSIHFQWRDARENLDGVRRAVRLYRLPPATQNNLMQNIMKADSRAID